MSRTHDDRSKPVRLSVIVPFHRDLTQLRQCLRAVRTAGRALPDGVTLADVIVVADGAVDDPKGLALEHGARLVAIAGPQGPAVARSRGAAVASGHVLVFVDTDVVMGEDALAKFAELFAAQPDLGAAFGAYDECPADPGFLSQGRNLAHSFIHQRADPEAHTFWAGLGAVRADVFAAVGGFDERFAHPSVEDIDLGYRIRAAGFRIRLDARIQGTHLKRWTLRSGVVTDIRDRGVPWTQLLNRYHAMRNDLNVSVAYRACVVIAYLLASCLIGALRWPVLLAFSPVGVAGLWYLDRSYYQFFVNRRGVAFAIGWFPIHVLHHLCNGVSFAVGTMLYGCHRSTGVALPWTLPLTAWSGPPPSALTSPKPLRPAGDRRRLAEAERPWAR